MLHHAVVQSQTLPADFFWLLEEWCAQTAMVHMGPAESVKAGHRHMPTAQKIDAAALAGLRKDRWCPSGPWNCTAFADLA